jgi:hypothetical protein
MDDNELKQLIASNAKVIAALTNLANEILPRVDEMQRQVTDMQRQHLVEQRQIDDTHV